ncbi:hypothetical protein AYX14_01194 [Cryptococcus neoformans]|nr:hypothetical protein AYX14_01194 [Cryptococcus neoformans var. grubii]
MYHTSCESRLVDSLTAIPPSSLNSPPPETHMSYPPSSIPPPLPPFLPSPRQAPDELPTSPPPRSHPHQQSNHFLNHPQRHRYVFQHVVHLSHLLTPRFAIFFPLLSSILTGAFQSYSIRLPCVRISYEWSFL